MEMERAGADIVHLEVGEPDLGPVPQPGQLLGDERVVLVLDVEALIEDSLKKTVVKGQEGGGGSRGQKTEIK